MPGNAPSEAALASRKTLDTVKAAEQIIEALDACREEESKERTAVDQVISDKSFFGSYSYMSFVFRHGEKFIRS